MKRYAHSLSIVLVFVLGICGFGSVSQAGVLYGEDYFLVFVGAASLGVGIDRGATGAWTERFYHEGELALYLEGYVLGNVLIEMLIDTSNPALLDVLDLDPYEHYPIYGDGSTINKDAAQHGRLYIALNRDESSALYGRNQVQLEQGEYLQFRQELSGAYVDIQETGYDVQIVYGHILSQKIREEFPGAARPSDDQRDWEKFLGITGPFHLEQTPVLRGSERVYVEIRSPHSPRLVLERRRLEAHEYNFEYSLGRLEIQDFISWFDEQGRPVTVVVEYEHVGPTATHRQLYGFLGGFELGSILRFEAGHLRQEEEHRVTTLGISFTPMDTLVFHGQWAQDGIAKGQAGEIGAQFTGDQWQAHALLRFSDDEFFGFNYATPGQDHYAFGASGRWNAFGLTGSVNRHQGPKAPQSAVAIDTTETAVAGTYDRPSGFGVTLRGVLEQIVESTEGQATKDETIRTVAIETVFPISEFLMKVRNQWASIENHLHADGSTRNILHGGEVTWPKDTTVPYLIQADFEWERKASSAGTPMTREFEWGAGIEYDVLPSLTASLRAEHQRTNDLQQSTDRSKTTYLVGMEAQFNELWQGNVEQGIETAVDIHGHKQTASVTRAKISGTSLDQFEWDLYGRYRYPFGGSSSTPPETILGYHVIYEANPYSTIGLTHEWSVDSRQNREHQVDVRWQLGSVLQVGAEYRRKLDDVEQVSYGLNTTWTPDPDVTLFGALERGSKKVDDEQRQRRHQMLAVAYRPVTNHSFDLIAMVRRETVQDHSKQTLWSMDGVLHYSAPYTLSLNWIHRNVSLDGVAATTDFKQIGLVAPVANRWDFGAQYRLISQTDSRNRQSLTVEVGYAVLEQLRVSIGYNFQGYDVPGFHNDQHNKPGINLGLQVVF